MVLLSLAIWSSGHPVIRTSDHSVFWPCGHLIIWPSDHLVICLSGHPDFWPWSSGHLVIRPSGHLTIQSSDLPVMVIQISGHLIIQSSGHPVFWSSGHIGIFLAYLIVGYTNLKFLTSSLSVSQVLLQQFTNDTAIGKAIVLPSSTSAFRLFWKIFAEVIPSKIHLRTIFLLWKKTCTI